MNITHYPSTTAPNVPEPPRHSGWRRYLNLKLIVSFALLLIATTSLALRATWEQPLISPLNALTTFQFLPEDSHPIPQNKVVYGFLPYWNLNKTQVAKELSHVSYFSLTMAADGTIITVVDGETEPGFNKLQSEQFLDISSAALAQGSKVEIVLTQFNRGDILAFLSSPKAQANLLQSLDAIMLAYPISGVNIDIELAGGTPPETRAQMTQFMTVLSNPLRTKYVGTQLSVDVYAGAAKGDQLWEIEKLAPLVDYIVVMAYDFHRKSSAQAGPVAPLFGGREMWDSDINEHLQEFVKKAPKSKILLGVPFYGYEWQTTSRQSQSHTFPDSGSTASIERVSDLLTNHREEYKVQEHWNEDALSPYLSYVKDGKIYVIYYENSRSLSYKLDYVNQLDLGGIAIWALGYEGDSRELWDVIERKILN